MRVDTDLRIGLLAIPFDTGLGVQTYEFWRHMNPLKTLVADISKIKGMPAHNYRFPGARISDGVPSNEDVQWLATDVDIVFVCETPLNYWLFAECRKRGVVSVLQYNYELLQYFNEPWLPRPDYFAAPTSWHRHQVESLGQVIDLRVPVATDSIRTRQIKKLETIVHIAGKQAARDRNDTEIFIEVARSLGDQFRYLMYAQHLSDRTMQMLEHTNIEVRWNTPNYYDMYAEGDLMVLPRRYGGLCLPMNEALAAGMPVFMPDIVPNWDILPPNWLVPAEPGDMFRRVRVFNSRVDHWVDKILYIGRKDYYHYAGRAAVTLGRDMSWNFMKNQYLETLGDLV